MNNTKIILMSAEINTKDDIKSLFSFDSQFVKDEQYQKENNYQEDGISLFDEILQEHDWKEDIDHVIYLLGRRLLYFNEDYQYFDCKRTNNVVSVVFGKSIG